MRFHPADVQSQFRTGNQNMDSTTASVGLDGEGWCFLGARIHFAGGSGTALCTLSVLNRDDPDGACNATLYDCDNVPCGTGTDLNIAQNEEADEMMRSFSFAPNQRLVFNWTNPSSLTMRWGLEARIVPWSKIIRDA